MKKRSSEETNTINALKITLEGMKTVMMLIIARITVSLLALFTGYDLLFALSDCILACIPICYFTLRVTGVTKFHKIDSVFPILLDICMLYYTIHVVHTLVNSSFIKNFL